MTTPIPPILPEPPGRWDSRKTADLWRAFAGSSETDFSPVRQLALEAADDPEMLVQLVTSLGGALPNLVLAVSRLQGGPIDRGYQAWKTWALNHWAGLVHGVRGRRVQTNDVNRAGVIMPVLVQLEKHWGEPVALLEIGTAAGLLLHLEHFAYRYRHSDTGRSTHVGLATSPVTVTCTIDRPGLLPKRPPKLAWAGGLDLRPLSVRNQQHTHWLELGVWPRQVARLNQLRAALRLARQHPVNMYCGGVFELAPVARLMPTTAPKVVLAIDVLRHLDDHQRTELEHIVRFELDAHLLAADLPEYLPYPVDLTGWPRLADPLIFIVTLDGTPLAASDPNGHHLHWHRP